MADELYKYRITLRNGTVVSANTPEELLEFARSLTRREQRMLIPEVKRILAGLVAENRRLAAEERALRAEVAGHRQVERDIHTPIFTPPTEEEATDG